MLKKINIYCDDIIHQIKISYQISEVVEGIVSHRIILSKANEIGIDVDNKELQKAADIFRKKKNLLSAEATWAWLQKNSLSLDDFENIIYTSVLSSKFIKYLFAEQIEPYFQANKMYYTSAAIYEIILDDEDLANQLFYAIQKKEVSFFEASQQYIKDIELRRCGGYRGIMHYKDLKPEISSAVFTACPPQLLKPILTSQGIHLILVEEIIQPQLNEKLNQKIASDLFCSWLKQQVEQIEVIVDLESSG